MRKVGILAALLVAALAPRAGAAQETAGQAAAAEAPVVAEARVFMAGYARELLAGDRAAIAARYDRRGAHFLGAGERETMAYEQIVERYAGAQWQPPAAFEWRDLLYEPLGPDAVAVTGTFHWTPAAGQPPIQLSYTGLLVRQEGVLRIRIEDEDAAPRRP